MYKMVFKSALPQLICAIYVQIFSVKNVVVVSVSVNNLSLPFDYIEIHKKMFLFLMVEQSSISNSRLSSLGIFKHKLLKFLHFLSCNYLFYLGDCPVSISHTHLRLNYHLFQKKFFSAVLHLPVLFVMHLNISSYTTQVLLLCLKGCWPTMHNNITWKQRPLCLR